MKKKSLVKSLLLASILPLCSFMVDDKDDTTPKEDQQIVLGNDSNVASGENSLKVPVTATLSNQLLNVKFKGFVPVATVTVTNTTTGSSSSTTLPTTSGTIVSLPITAGMGIVTVTDEKSGESVSGEFEVEE